MQKHRHTFLTERIFDMQQLSSFKPQAEIHLRECFPELSIAKSSDSLLEIMTDGVNKAAAVKYLCELRKIPLSRTMAFGDNYNDLEMLETVECGVLMGNAPSELQKHFSFITKTNAQDGIFLALKEFGIL